MWFLFINSSITSADDQGLFVCLKSSETKEFVIFSVLGIYLTYTTVLGSKLGYVLCQHDVSIKDIFRQFNFNIALYVFNGFFKINIAIFNGKGNSSAWTHHLHVFLHTTWQRSSIFSSDFFVLISERFYIYMRLLLQNESVCYYPLCISLIMQRAEPTPGHKYFGFKSRGRDVMLEKAIMEAWC